jgi:uncharacterized protein YdeI (YjbR/CyaY-like superfamily)
VSATYFAKPEEFRAWLEANHQREDEMWVGFYRKATGEPGMTWPESVDEALCFGWIDGLRRSVDERRYRIRFTQRRPKSNWSAVNIERANALIEEGRMRPAGLAAFEARDEARSRVYAYEREKAAFPAGFESRFRADSRAWSYWKAQPPHYRRTVTHWVVSAKREATRERRLERLITDCAEERWIGAMRVGRND